MVTGARLGWSFGSSLRALAAGVVFVASAASFFAGCQGKTCEEGGGVVVNGVCEGKCDSSKCLEGNVCSANRCVLKCAVPTDCAQGQSCSPAKADDGTDIMACVDTKKAQDVNLGCPNGDECAAASACPDGTPCDGTSAAACPAEQCKPLLCASAGVGDAYAYCTTVNCKADADCVQGMWCEPVRRADKICGTMKGTDDPCIDPSAFTANGDTYQEGPVSILQNVCTKRGDCAPCATDLDCNLEPDQACVDIGGEKRCARGCTANKDCEDDHQCDPADGRCKPKFGTCTGNGNFCEPCVTDLDCAAGGPTMACFSLQGTQRGCLDGAFAKTCKTDNDCPVAPSGKHGHCLTADEGGPDLANHCFAPLASGTNEFKCY